MWRVECLEDYGSWCRKGTTIIVNNGQADYGETKGHLRKIRFLGMGNKRIKDKDFIGRKIKFHKDKVKFYKRILEDLE